MRHKYPRSGPALDRKRTEAGAKRNEGTMQSRTFLKACELAQVEPSRRQASKWNNGKGAAYAERFNARRMTGE